MTAIVPGIWPPWGSTSTPVNDANYQAIASDTFISVINLTASRTVFLPPSATLFVGKVIGVKDTNGHVSAANRLTVAPNGTDTIDGLGGIAMILPFDYCELVYVGSGNWAWKKHPQVYQQSVAQAARQWALPSGGWTMCPLGADLLTDSTVATMHPGIGGFSAQIVTVGALPQASIQVNNLVGTPPSSGFFTVTGPPGAGIDTIIKYTGFNSGTSTFTGCTLGTGTLAAGQAVNPACNGVFIGGTGPNAFGYWNLQAIATFPAAGNTTGQIGVRFVGAPPLFVPSGSILIPNPNAVETLSITTAPSITVGPPAEQFGMQLFNSTGVTLTIPIDGAQAPILGGAFWTMQA